MKAVLGITKVNKEVNRAILRVPLMVHIYTCLHSANPHLTLDEPLDTLFSVQTYASLPAGEFQLIRQTLLSFFQDMHIRVSVW